MEGPEQVTGCTCMVPPVSDELLPEFELLGRRGVHPLKRMSRQIRVLGMNVFCVGHRGCSSTIHQ